VLLRFVICGQSFSERQGTFFYDLKLPEEKVIYFDLFISNPILYGQYLYTTLDGPRGFSVMASESLAFEVRVKEPRAILIETIHGKYGPLRRG